MTSREKFDIVDVDELRQKFNKKPSSLLKKFKKMEEKR